MRQWTYGHTCLASSSSSWWWWRMSCGDKSTYETQLTTVPLFYSWSPTRSHSYNTTLFIIINHLGLYVVKFSVSHHVMSWQQTFMAESWPSIHFACTLWYLYPDHHQQFPMFPLLPKTPFDSSHPDVWDGFISQVLVSWRFRSQAESSFSASVLQPSIVLCGSLCSLDIT